MVEITPIVSIITPAYKCEETIGETIESVIAQTYSGWEMIIINDCSPDNTRAIVEKYSKIDTRINLINLKENSGSAVARNTGIAEARGRYIALLDADDLWKKEKLTEQLRFMSKKKCSLSFTAYEVFRNSADKRRRVFNVPKSIAYKRYLGNSVIGCLTVMVDREYIPDFHMEFGYLEDILTWMHYLRHGNIAYGLNKNLASYRIASKSKSANKFKNALRYYRCLKEQPSITYFERYCCEVSYIYNALKKRLFGQIIDYSSNVNEV